MLGSAFLFSRFSFLDSLEPGQARLGARKGPKARRLRRINAPRRSAHPWAGRRNPAPTSSDTVRNIKSRFLHYIFARQLG